MSDCSLAGVDGVIESLHEAVPVFAGEALAVCLGVNDHTALL